jgi:hypothetical protein
MMGSLPGELIEVFERSVTAEYATIDGRGQPVVWPVTPQYHAAEGCIDVTRESGQAADCSANAHVALLFSEGTERGDAPMVLVQGTADVAADTIHVRPERIYVWPRGDLEAEPALYDAHLDEVRAAHNEEPEVGHAAPEGGGAMWDGRLDELGDAAPNAVLAFVGPDGFPFAARVPVRADRSSSVVRIDADPIGAPIEPGLACLCARNRHCFHVLGDLDEDHGGWILRPHRIVDAPQRAAERAGQGA